MIRKRLAFKIGFLIIGLALIVLLSLYLSVNEIFRYAYYQQAGTDLLTKGHEYAQLIGTGLNTSIRHVCSASNNELLIVNQSGALIDKSNLVTLHRASQTDIHNIKLALSGKALVRNAYSSMFGDSGVLSLTPIVQGHTVTGVVALFQPYGVISRAFQQIEYRLILAGVGAIMVALGLTVLLSHSLTQPLTQMANVAKAIGRGNYNIRVPVTSEDEIGRLAMAIQDMTHNLHHLDTTRREFLADISHELRTPLSYVHGYSQVLREGLAKTREEERKFIDIIHYESERIEKLVTDLFTLAQTDEGVLRLAEEETLLGDVIASVIERFQHAAVAKGITIEFRAIQGDAPVRVDPRRMEQVMVNLLDNAIRYTPNGGTITVDMSRRANDMQVKVSDTGVGIPRGQLPYIWDRLYRVEKSRSRERGGTGLGLAVVKQIIDLHGGTVEADSRNGGGTIITITIPFRKAAEHQ